MQSRHTPKIKIGDLVRKKYMRTTPLCIVIDIMPEGDFDYIRVFYKDIHPIEASRGYPSYRFTLISSLDFVGEEDQAL